LFAAVGFLAAPEFFYPLFLSNYVWIAFKRPRPARLNGLLLGSISSGSIAATFYIVVLL